MNRLRILSMSMALFCWGFALSSRAAPPTVTPEEARLLERVSEVAQDDVGTALRLLNEARIGKRSSAALDYTAGRLFGGQHDAEGAAEAFRMALHKQPDFTAARMGLGHALAALSRWNEAEDILRPLARSDAAEREVLLLYAHVLVECGHTLAAETIYRGLLQSEGESPDVLLGLTRCFVMQNRSGEAAAALDSLIRIRPGDRALWALSADVWLAREEPAKALASLEVARRFGLADTPMLVQLGDLYFYNALPAAAVSVYREALDANRAVDAWTVRAAEGLLRTGAASAAGEWLDRYRDRGGEMDTRYLRVRAQWAEAAADTEAAREAYRAWTAHDPLDARALLGMGDIELRDGRAEHAALWYERARDAHPTDANPLLRLADLAVKQRDYRRAADWMERAHWLDSRSETHQAVIQLRRLAELENRPSATGETRHAETRQE